MVGGFFPTLPENDVDAVVGSAGTELATEVVGFCFGRALRRYLEGGWHVPVPRGGTSEAVAEAQAVDQRIDLGRTHLDAVDVHVAGDADPA